MSVKIKITIALMVLMSCKMTSIQIENSNVKSYELNPVVYNKNLTRDTVKSFTQFLSYVKNNFNNDTTYKVDDNQFSRWFDVATSAEIQAGQQDSNLFKKIALGGYEGKRKLNLWDCYLYQLRQNAVLMTINFKPFDNRKLSDSLLATLIDTGKAYMSKRYLSKKYEYVNLVVFKNNQVAQFWNLYRVGDNRFQITQITTCRYYIDKRTRELVLRFPSLNSMDAAVYIQDWIFKINKKTLSLCCKNTFTERGPAYYLTSEEEFVKVDLK